MKRRNLTTKWTVITRVLYRDHCIVITVSGTVIPIQVQYRRINKKGTLEENEKKRRSKKTVVRTREIVGLSPEMLEKKKSAKPVQKSVLSSFDSCLTTFVYRYKQKEAALKELKSRKGAKKGPKKM